MPFDPFKAAQQLDVPVRFLDFQSTRLCGVLIRGEFLSQIALNQNLSLPSQRFTLSHELSHYLLHQNHTQFLCDGCERSPLEWQANEAAAELLLPYRIFLPALSNIRSNSNRLSGLLQLSQRFGVSTQMVRNRVESLSYELWQYNRGVPVDRLKLVSRSRQTRLGLPCGPGPDYYFSRPSITVWNDEP